MGSIFMPTNRCIFYSPVAQPSGVPSFSVERDPDGQDDQDDRRDHRCGSEEFHRDLIHWRSKRSFAGFHRFLVALPPVQDLLLSAKDLFVAAVCSVVPVGPIRPQPNEVGSRGIPLLLTQFANVLIFSAAMGAAQWQTSRRTHPVRLRRNPVI
jgi:hypothetical protein